MIVPETLRCYREWRDLTLISFWQEKRLGRCKEELVMLLAR